MEAGTPAAAPLDRDTSGSSGGGGGASDEAAVTCSGVTKRFFNTVALDGIDLTIRRGEIHAIVGENGAGKSTLLGILGGKVEPTHGTISIFGTPLRFGHPRYSRQAGIAAAYQELMMVPAQSAQANVFLGQEINGGGFLREGAMRARFKELCDELDVQLDPDQRVGSMSVAQQQIVEILRGMAARARILLLDEPTAALAERERASILALMTRLCAQGVTIVIISHNLDEVLQVSDRVTVLRNGRHILTEPRAAVDKAGLVQAMLGRELATQERKTRTHSNVPVLHAEGVTLRASIEDISIEVAGGEILGLGGLVGSGRTSLFRCLAGLEPRSTGRLWISGKEVPWPQSPPQALRLGIAMIPEDRKIQGLVLGMSGIDNMTMATYGAVSSYGIVSLGSQRKIANELVNRFRIAGSVGRPVRTLSGGNQQKVLVAKWANRAPLILLADEPTRGIDVGAKAEVLRILQDFAGNGMAVMVASSELEEVVAVSDRIAVLSEGRLVQVIDNSTSHATVADVLTHAFRVTH
jgi:ABC-type sugar transport system ATPase subunit